MKKREAYLGDAVYAEELDLNGILLYTSDGERVSNKIFLEPEVWEALKKFMEEGEK